MPPTEEAVFASLIANAAVAHAEGLIRARDERIRREARDEALEDAAQFIAHQGLGHLADRIRAMKEAPRE